MSKFKAGDYVYIRNHDDLSDWYSNSQLVTKDSFFVPKIGEVAPLKGIGDVPVGFLELDLIKQLI